ncbi:MAG TPA: radical SAM protein [Polyangia bacterium]|nr:radical SAM protein [Polyangia bacterium]
MRRLRVLLVTPPMVQLNTPYPATAYLTGFLRQHAAALDLELAQADPALELFLRLFSRPGLARARDAIGSVKPAARRAMGPSVAAFLGNADHYLETVEGVIAFLQGHDPNLAARIAGRTFLPEGPRFAPLAGPQHDGGDGDDDGPLGWAFGALGIADRAKHVASLYVDDLADVIRDGIDARFELARYGERLAVSAASFEPLRAALEGPATLVDQMTDEIGAELARRHEPDLVGITAPFPGNVYGGFRLARAIRRAWPSARLALGGGYVNTELRELREPRVFDYFDYVTLDDGERPLLNLIRHLRGEAVLLHRTFVREGAGGDARVVLKVDPGAAEVSHADAGTPTYAGLPLDQYVSLFEMLNPVHRLWADGRWNKLTVARGCYWKKCTFCDVSLPYIGRYETASAELIVDRIAAMVAETGQTGFHFVDEAAPPAMLRAVAERLIARQMVISWWGNIRFEKTFTPALARLLARSGCIAVTGGLEVASDRLLALMRKGVTVAQVARVTRAFADAGVLVHAYLMYGFPTETEQETIDALERVRQLFAQGCIQSAFWHRFAATAWSPIGARPEGYGIRLLRRPSTFARNEVPFEDPVGTDHDRLGQGLRKALYNYMHGLGLDLDVRSWFAPAFGRRRVPRTAVPPDLIANALRITAN